MSLLDRIGVARKMTRGAGFIAERAARLRQGHPVPKFLALSSWPAYSMATA